MALLVRLLRKRIALSLTAVCASVFFAAVTLWWNMQLSDIINTVSAGHPLAADSVILAIFVMIVLCVAGWLKTYFSGYACEIFTHDLRMGYARYFSSLPISRIEHLNAGEQLSKLQNEIADVSGYLSGNLCQLMNDSISFISTLGWLLFVNTKLTLMVNLPVIVIMIYVFFSSKIISHATEQSQRAKGRMNKYADTLLTLFPIIRLYDAMHMMLGNYKSEVSKWEHQTVRAERLRARLMSLSGLLSNIPLMLLFLIGGAMVLDDTLLLGTLYVFLNLSGNVSGVMMNMPGFIAGFRRFSVNMNRLSPQIILAERGES